MAQSISQQQQLIRDSWLAQTSNTIPSASTSVPSTSNMRYGSVDRGGRETIHSGHFMVSHFEAEAQDDEDTEIEMPDPDENAIVELSPDTDVQLLNTTDPNATNALVTVNSRISSSSAVIDISLAKLFKCMNLAYRQKLTSPKWNSFKGIRLRWKDKIRLNNLIWRCWHMQFIMKQKTPVCQFASPLDVDLHSKPEAVVLEGKYWKRQFDVIKAEYMKWRKFYRNRGLGNNAILDTVSEMDIFDWSPCTSDNNMIDEYCWTADTLFSTINTPFPFPDPREIAKAGIADFIQPSLGPLQPNLDDFMNGIPLQELINSHLSSRLAPVPEESTDDMMFRSDVYDFPSIMPPEPMDSTIMQNATTLTDVSENLQTSQQLTHDALICGATQTNQKIQQSLNPLLQYGNVASASSTGMQYQSKIYGPQNMQQMPSSTMNQAQMQAQAMLSQNNAATNYINENQLSPTQASELIGNLAGAKKRSVKAIRSHQMGRREPHNYDKSTPTTHQTNIYNQILAQQNRNQMQLQQQQQQQQLTGIIGTPFNTSTNVYLAPQNVQSQVHTSPIQTTTNNYMNALNLSNDNNFVLQGNQMSSNLITLLSPNAIQTAPSQGQTALSPQQQQQQQQHALKQNSSLLTLLSMKSEDLTSSDSYKATTVAHQAAYKPYPTQQSLKNAGGYSQLSPRSHRLSSPPSHQMNTLLSERQNSIVSDKELYRSKSLPLNSTLQMPVVKEETFAVPKYQATKSTAARYRVRSNSMVLKHHAQHGHASSSLQNAASEPMLKSLAQLLTSSSGSGGATSSSQQSSLANIVTSQQQHSYVLQQQSSGSSSSIVSPTVPRPMPSNANSFMPNSTPSLSPESIADHDSPKYSRSGGAGSSAIGANLSPSAGTSTDSLQRRVGHIHAEQKRRYNIKNGFDMLHSLIPQLQQNPNAKLSKAAMLQKGAEYIRQLRMDRDSIKQKMDTLRKERDSLNNSLNHLHSVLPANGAPVARQRTGRLKELYNDYVRERTLRSWKFWILGLIFDPLLNSYNSTVSVASMDELYRTAMLWVDQHCSLIEIRPAVSDKLRYLSTTTDILSDPPSTLQEEVVKALSSNTNPSNL